MKLAIIGTRTLVIEDLKKHIPKGVTEIVSGGARGVDRQAADFAKTHGIKLTEFLPDYARFGKGAPLKRNVQIAEYADEVLAFWNGKSKGTLFTIELFKKLNKKVEVKIVEN